MPSNKVKKVIQFGFTEFAKKDECHTLLDNICAKLNVKRYDALYYALRYYWDYLKDRVVEIIPQKYVPKQNEQRLLIRR
jgi:uncharacterized protein (UPF0297 family)